MSPIVEPREQRLLNTSGQHARCPQDPPREADAFALLVETHHAPIRRLVTRLLGWPADCDDVVQEVFLAAWKGWDRFRGESTAGTWLTRIAINQCRRQQRRQRLGWAILERLQRTWSGAHAPPATQPTMDRELAVEVRKAVERLNPRDREVVVLYYLEHWSIDAMAEALALRRGTIEVRLSRARARLRTELKSWLET